MAISHILLAVLVALIWGFNFMFVKLGLNEMGPLLLCTLRFFLASVPVIFFIKRPTIPHAQIIYYGLVMFALQFALLFLGMHLGMSTGMAPLVMQAQVFFSMFFAAIFLGEQASFWQIVGAMVAICGISLVGLHLDQSISLLGFVCILGSAATWGVGNLITKKMRQVNMAALVIWGSFYAAIPMSLCTLIFEGRASIVHTYHHFTWVGVVAVGYIVYVSTWVGYGVWNWLIGRYPVGKIVPFTLLVPVVGMLSAVVFLGEPMQVWKLGSGCLVLLGLVINLLGPKYLLRPMFRKAVP